MGEYSKGLIRSGFINKKGKIKKQEMGDRKWKEYLKKISDIEAEQYADEEWAEEASIEAKLDSKTSDYFPTGFPPADKRFKLLLETYNYSIEEMYYWIISQLRRDQAYHTFYKITDTFSASEQSSFWGAAQTRMKIQQDNVSQYLVTIGKMVKDLFQIVRELRIIDERLEIYDKWEELKSADVTLKGLYIDLVEGASKNPSSVYGLAQQVGFTILPDLFFNTQVFKSEDIDRVVDATEYNKAIKNVLKRKLMSYITWKTKTDKELRDRRKFQLKYLRQHWVVIKMYMDWIKPYLRNIRRMQMDEKMIESVDLVSAFETSMTEIEFMAVKPTKTGAHPVVLASFEYRTRPDMTFQQDNYAHRGPIHVGRVKMELRSYGWSEKDINNYKKYRREEGMRLFSVIDESVKAAMDALGDEMEQYLEEAGEPIERAEEPKGETKKKRRKASWGILEPFIAVIKGVGELAGALVPMPSMGGSEKSKGPKEPTKAARESAAKTARTNMWLTYKNYKKSRRMITW
ncbi:hypothetical protein ACFLTH_05685 [Bacteroidota bacterium]